MEAKINKFAHLRQARRAMIRSDPQCAAMNCHELPQRRTTSCPAPSSNSSRSGRRSSPWKLAVRGTWWTRSSWAQGDAALLKTPTVATITDERDADGEKAAAAMTAVRSRPQGIGRPGSMAKVSGAPSGRPAAGSPPRSGPGVEQGPPVDPERLRTNSVGDARRRLARPQCLAGERDGARILIDPPGRCYHSSPSARVRRQRRHRGLGDHAEEVFRALGVTRVHGEEGRVHYARRPPAPRLARRRARCLRPRPGAIAHVSLPSSVSPSG